MAALIDLAPQDAAAIEKAAMQVINEADPDALTGNNRVGLQRMSRRLVAWNQGGKHDEVLARLHASMTAKCSAQTPRAWCEELFAPAKRA